jgi:hypothetical protein
MVRSFTPGIVLKRATGAAEKGEVALGLRAQRSDELVQVI